MQYSTHNNLKLMEGTDNVRRQDFVDNFNAIDNGLSKFYVATQSSANVYKITTGLNKTSLANGYSVKVAIPSASNGAVSIIIDGCNAVAVKKPNSTSVTNFKANGVYSLVYYNSVFILASGGGGDDVDFATSDLLEGKTANNSDGEKVIGTMKNRSDTKTPWCGYEKISVQPHPQAPDQALITVSNAYKNTGFFNEGSAVTGNVANLNSNNIKYGVKVGRNDGSDTNCITGSFTGDATAQAKHILSGQSAYVKGQKVNGNMPNRGEAQYTGGIGSGSDYIAFNRIPYGYYPQSSNGWAPEIRARKSDFCNTFGITPDKIVSGQNILDVWGTAPNFQLVQGTFVRSASNNTINLGFTPKLVITDFIMSSTRYINICQTLVSWLPRWFSISASTTSAYDKGVSFGDEKDFIGSDAYHDGGGLQIVNNGFKHFPTGGYSQTVRYIAMR